MAPTRLSCVVAFALCTTIPAQNAYFTGDAPITELNQPGSSSFSPTLSEDELYMVFASDRPGGLGGYDLYETQRPSVDSLWGPPQNLVQLNSSAADWEPNLSYDGLELYFISTRAGGIGMSDVYRSTRPVPGAPWGPPQNLGSPVNQPGVANDDPFLTQDGLRLFLTSSLGAGGADIFVAQRPSIGAPFGPLQVFAPAASPQFDHSPVVDGSGDTVWFSSNRPGGPAGSSDWYMTYRDPLTGMYAPAVPIPDLCTADWDSNGWHAGRTGRFYSSQFVGATSFLWIRCPRLVVTWVERCLISLCIPHFQLFPPRVWWERVWPVSILVPVITIQWYTWFPWPLGGFCLPFASLGTGPDIPASAVLPGGEGTLILDLGTLVNVGAFFHPPGAPAGISSISIAVPPNPAFIGQVIVLQDAGLDANFHLMMSEATRIQFTP